jgi:hypothetical protein
MSETEGLLADATAEGDDNQQQTEEQSIPHLQPDAEPSVDSVTVASEDDEVEFTRPDYFPEKFWNDEDGPDLENLVKSYTELQKKFSQGQHKVPDEYDQSVFTDAGIPEDDELYSTYREWAKSNGVSQSAFNDLAEKFIEMAGLQNEEAAISHDEEYKKLGPNADATIKSMTTWAQSLVNKGVWGPDDFEEFKIMGGTAQGIKALQKVRSYYGDKPIPVDIGPVDGAPSKDELMSMVGKPEYQTDPAFRAKVEKAFEKAYGSQEYSAI